MPESYVVEIISPDNEALDASADTGQVPSEDMETGETEGVNSASVSNGPPDAAGTLATSSSLAVEDHLSAMDPDEMGFAAPEQAVEITADLGGNQVVVIDGAVEDAASLVAALGPDVQVIVLDPMQDGIAQIADALAGQSGIDGLHIVSHGDAGHLQLGSTLLDADAISGSYAEDLAQIGSALSDGGDILIYGCNFGAGEDGAVAMAALAEVTLGDIAASDDRTGADHLGGDWELEVAQGTIESETLEFTGWDHVLADWYGTAGSDTLTDTSGTYSNVYGYASNDSLQVGSGTLYGGDGADYLRVYTSGDIYGEDGNETIYGINASYVDGGAGTDLFATLDVTYDVTVDLNNTSSQLIGGGNWVTLSNIENITANSGDDSLSGNAGDNVIYSGTGQNTVSGAGGDDTFYNNVDDDLIYGGSGADVAHAGSGDDLIYGDQLSIDPADYASTAGSSTSLTINNNAGETIQIHWINGAGSLVHYGTISSPGTFSSTTSVNHNWVITDTSGNYRELIQVTGATTFDYNASDMGDTLNVSGGSDTIYGESGDDQITAGDDADTVYGGTGDDTIYGGDGADVLWGGEGDDYFAYWAGGVGNDTVYGGVGSGDHIDFAWHTGQVTVVFSDGEDGTITDGTDTLSFDNIEEFTLTAQADSVDGTLADNDMYVVAGAGDDTITGSSDGDTLEGGDDNDEIDGAAGGDSIDGGTGSDQITGGLGSDTLTGGTGEDTFVSTSGDGRDTITDFDIADDDSNGFFNDQLDVSGLIGGTGTAGAVRAFDVVVSDDGSGNALLTFPNGEELVLQGVAPASVTGAPNLYAAGIPLFHSIGADRNGAWDGTCGRHPAG